jgi:methylthioribose-1-phosphate isomerase
MRTITWKPESETVEMIDQRLLPGEFRLVEYSDPIQISEAIRDMVIRGAPVIGVAAAYGLALASIRSKARSLPELKTELHQAADQLAAARPTAVNLAWALQRILETVDRWGDDLSGLRVSVLAEAERIANEDVDVNLRMARYGSELLEDGDTVIHHCNTGALAAVEWGTALGVIRMAHQQGKKIHVFVDETRPRLQGARLTAWELQQYGISYEVICDSAAGYLLSKGEVQKVLFGADRIAANGDVANKIGTYMLALAAHTHQIPVYAVAPLSTFDFSLEHGGLIPIEERPMDEVLNIQIEGQPVAPQGALARNPAFDVTPNHLLTAIVTEKGVISPPYFENLARYSG